MTNELSYSVCWGSESNRATETNSPYTTNAEAKAARDAAYRALPEDMRKNARRWGFEEPTAPILVFWRSLRRLLRCLQNLVLTPTPHWLRLVTSRKGLEMTFSTFWKLTNGNPQITRPS